MLHSQKKICVLGSTGSVGRRTLDVARDHPEEYRVVGLSAHGSVDLLKEQVAEFGPAAACLSGVPNPGLNGPTRWLNGPKGILELIEACEPDLVVNALVGAAGLEPTLMALGLGIPVGLANKEVLVSAGRLTMNTARQGGVPILPIDSEHNAIFQCLAGNLGKELRRVILTASGGPFRGRHRAQLEHVTLEEALKHPTWTMGRKITIDSATLMNKGFEVIEGHHLFDVDVDRFEVIVHPQSVIHSMVEFIDGSMLAQLGPTDMYFPIANVLSYPERLENRVFEPLDLAAVSTLTFEKHDPLAFPCLDYAIGAAKRGGTYPAALNAANEVAVERFLNGEIRFWEIPEIIDAVLQSHASGSEEDLDAIRHADAQARQQAREVHLTKA